MEGMPLQLLLGVEILHVQTDAWLKGPLQPMNPDSVSCVSRSWLAHSCGLDVS